jgi:transcriptional regulator with XRE-family HTH domain
MRTKEAIRQRILELCKCNGLTVNGLSGKCGITQSTLNNIVSGRNNSATVSTIQKVCDGLEMELPEFFDSELFRNIEQEIK